MRTYYTVEEIPGKPGEYRVTVNQGANGFRLPTEDQWEYACRAMTTTKFAFGDAEKDLVDYGVFGGNSESRTAQVGSLRCNAWGLFDMHGNVWEWCEDLQGGSVRVDRGGSWFGTAGGCRSSDRGYGYDPSFRRDSTWASAWPQFRPVQGPEAQEMGAEPRAKAVRRRGRSPAANEL